MKTEKTYTNSVLKWTLRFIYLLIGLVLIYGIGRFIDVTLDRYYSGIRAPYLQMVGTNQATIQWQTIESEQGVVRYGSDLRNLNNTAKDIERSNTHKVILQNLKPNTRYFYSVGSHDKVFKGGTRKDWFVTAPIIGKQQSLRFWVLGDPGDWKHGIFDVRDSMINWLDKNKRLNRPDLDLIITTGDNAYVSGSNKQFQKAVFEPFSDFLRNYSYWPAYGNHDARRSTYFDIFSFPTNGQLGGVASNSEHYFSFDYASVHFVFLDTPKADLSSDGKMLTWLRQDLLKTKQDWLIAVFHYPPYTKGTHDSDNVKDTSGNLITTRENILPILERYGVDLVLTGHSHMYERSYLMNCHYGYSTSLKSNMILDKSKGTYEQPYYKYSKKIAPHEGTVYVVTGSSSKVDDGPMDHPANVVNIKSLGSMVIEIDGNRLDAKFINDKMQILDNFSIVKGHVDSKITNTSCP